MKSRLLLTATAAAIAITLAGCNGGGSGAGGDSSSSAIEVQTGQAVDSKLLATLTEITVAFEKENPSVKIDLVPGQGAGYEKNIKVRLASGNIPDIWWTHGWSRDRYKQFLMPLQDEPWAEHFNPSLDAAMKDSDGAFYALPIDTDIAGLLYNEDVLADAGFEVDDIATWDDFMDAAEAMKELDDVSPIYVAGKESVGNVADWISPGTFDEADLAKMTDGTFLTENYAEVLDLVSTWTDAGLFNADYSSANGDGMARALAQGKAGFVFSQNATAFDALQYNPDAKLGFMPVPSANGGASYLIGGEMNAYGISKTTEHEEGAKAFLAFLAQPENESRLAQSAGSAPGLLNAETDLDALQASYDNHVTDAQALLVPYFDRVYLPNGSWDTMVTTTDAIVTQQSDVDSAVGQMESTFKSLYGQGN